MNNPFKSQNRKKNEVPTNKGEKAKEYKINIWQSDGMPNNYETIYAKLETDDAGVQFLKWEKKDKVFKEIFPRRKNVELHHKDLKEVNEKIRRKRELLTKVKNNPDQEEKYGKYYDIEKQINDLKSEKKVLEHPNYTFVVIEKGEQTINFQKEGSYLIPLGFDKDKGVILRPSDALTDNLSASYFTKKEKYGIGTALKWASIILLLLNFFFLLGNGYLFYKNVAQYSDSTINEIREQCLRDIAEVSDLVKGISTEDLREVVKENDKKQKNQKPKQKQDDNPLEIDGGG